MDNIKVGEIWKHYKTGGQYMIINFGILQVKDAQLDEKECVIYQNILDQKIWIRPVEDFLEIVDSKDMAQQKRRFQKVN